ncbi:MULTISPECIES: lipopolysaccharide biosynthesis protein [Clostridium]|uniref:lipopolysaccharide biosynthesis protein n=1 Tax=Clostridium TaxID=1485 RepID=UPI000C0799EC|nr:MULTISPECIES: hypothetical protein [Clostridium]MDB2091680.1 hypothetical protein [Clostridium paraputrificum]MDB2098645.1 hypothetical protein [Clostridium paraputrificum]
MMNKKGINIKLIAGDMLLNIVATILPILILQFIILPLLAGSYGQEEYGLILTLISLITLSVQSFSIALSNSRLLMNNEYKDLNIKGDFNILLILYSILNIIFVTIGTYIYEGTFNFKSIVLIIILSVIQLTRRYLLVAFRLNISYKKILYNNIILGIGYGIGFVIFWFFKSWQIIYITGELISLIYIIRRSDLIYEPLKKTQLFQKTTKQSLVLLGASFLGTAITYIDKLLLYPILGPKMVTVYYVSTLFGKTVSMLVGPINNVILTYLSKMRKFKNKSFKLILISLTIVGIFAYISILVISSPILGVLYPDYAEEAMKIIYITTLGAIINMMSNVINPVIMKFCNISWQMWVNVANIIVYVIFSLCLVKSFGIYGFCISALMAAIVKLVLMIYIYYNTQLKLKE